MHRRCRQRVGFPRSWRRGRASGRRPEPHARRARRSDLGEALVVARCPAILDRDIATFAPPALAKPLHKCSNPLALTLWCAFAHEADGRRFRLLRPRRERPHCQAAEQRDELAPPDHSITSSARASSVGGSSSPSVFAVLTLMTSSNVLGCSTGISAGFAPRRILSTTSAARRHKLGQFGPYDIRPPVSTYTRSK